MLDAGVDCPGNEGEGFDDEGGEGVYLLLGGVGGEPLIVLRDNGMQGVGELRRGRLEGG